MIGNGGSSEAETLIRIKGGVVRIKRIDESMSAGKIEIEGSAGMHVGTGMKGREIIVVCGDADSWAGMEMTCTLEHKRQCRRSCGLRLQRGTDTLSTGSPRIRAFQ
ncbi:Formylmethanofuran dehydrogenase (molybdenum) subunit C [Methanosarcina barkeri str. Wiesmoor]|uniref:Formylmethanofuran dehydrogenase (Molybdenum) subunit C n=2 Tax=Methanosarcina barkeri TaxID=2208 RepID=A0A0E3QQ82_METBA|nr:formylmethanofuran dehydrogenase subunit C [Methanosarcina barkeri]AKB52229.1 Formylmethanofuran dehydrogenase (molybdenum) subunit C [Methanosarcina barkeri str. Wiesmoor]